MPLAFARCPATLYRMDVPLAGASSSRPKELLVLAVHAFDRIELGTVTDQVLPWTNRSAGYAPFGKSGHALCLRYGVVSFVGGASEERRQFLSDLEAKGNRRRKDDVESEELRIVVSEGSSELRPDTCRGGRVFLSEPSLPRLLLIAEIVARSVIVADYEAVLAEATNTVEPLAHELATLGISRQSTRSLLRNIGVALRTRQALIGRIEVQEKPELLWERPELERLYLQLMDELEIAERNSALEAKISLLTDASRIALDLVHTNKSLRVEWYIVILIVFEIVLTLLHKF